MPAARTKDGPAVPRHPPGSSSDDGGTQFCPGGTEATELWPVLWSKDCERLEPLSRALAAALRHGGPRDALMLAQECGMLEERHTFSVNDV